VPMAQDYSGVQGQKEQGLTCPKSKMGQGKALMV
jgi:hypothetical protein